MQLDRNPCIKITIFVMLLSIYTLFETTLFPNMFALNRINNNFTKCTCHYLCPICAFVWIPPELK